MAGAIGGLIVWYLIANKSDSGPLGLFFGLIVLGLGIWQFSKVRQEAKKLMKQSCSCAGSSVQYLEWYGTMHTFVFKNKAYMERFLSANSRKTRSDVRET